MDFILGILTGAFLMLTWGYFLSRKDKKKEGIPKHRNPPEPPHIPIEHYNSMRSFLNHSLQQALESEDYEKAAQLRDLIKKQ